ncbi:MAG TPA: hypothetical protein VER96_01385 [Polyangiaceae bacterium]|nr:hypothetical protein [Polyangiaceae bacterium]
MRFAPYLVGLGLAVVVPFACSSPTSTATTVVRPELIAVDPDDFMGHVRCEPPPVPLDENAGAGGADDGAGNGGSGGRPPVARDPKAVHSYVATLFDVTTDGEGGAPKQPVPLASSGPTTCVQQATFAFVVQYRRYVAEIDAYHEEPNELEPISPGSRLMMKKADGSRAIPGWNVAVCGGYPPSPGSGGAGGVGGGASVGGGAAIGGGPPGIISYPSITQTPHNCTAVLEDPETN